MDPDAGRAPKNGGTEGDVDLVRVSVADAPQCRGALVAEDGIRPARQDRGRPPSVHGNLRTADDVDAPVDRMEFPRLDPVANGPGTEPELKQLPPGNHAMLPPHQPPSRVARRSLNTRGRYGNYKRSAKRIRPRAPPTCPEKTAAPASAAPQPDAADLGALDVGLLGGLVAAGGGAPGGGAYEVAEERLRSVRA
jgi:hypothetical protein